ncbi:MAG: hypothetical protein ACRER7_09100 [Gammaproteobacteria bacterium]
MSLTPGFRCILKALQAGHLNFYLALIRIVLVVVLILGVIRKREQG